MDGNHGEIHPKASDFVPTGVPFIMASDLKGGRVDLRGCARISPEQAEGLRKGFARTGDVLISHKGTIGRTAIVGEIPEDYLVLTPQVTYYRVLDHEFLNPSYLRIYFDSYDFQALFDAWANSGSTRAYLGITAQRQLPVVVPPITTQRAIASVLGALDDKIEANRQLNETLETTCQAIFRSWFVDFDPVVAKSEGRRPPHLTDEVAALFPDRFEDSTLGPVPAGWEPGTVGDIADNPRRKADPTAVVPSTPYIGLEHLPKGSIVLDAWGEAAAVTSAKWEFRRGEVLFGKLRPYFHKVGVALCDGICSTDVVVVAAKQEHDFGLLLGTLSSREFVDYADGTAGGTRQPRTSWHDMARYAFAIPPDRIRVHLTRVARRVEDCFATHAAETRTLTALHRTLLPRLLSGDIRVRQAENLVEEAV